MADSERLGASFSIDTTDLKAGLAQANRLIRESQSEFKAAAAGLDDWSHSEEGLQAKIKSLNDITDLQRKKVDALQGEYDKLIADGLDPTSRAAVDLRTKINNEQAALSKNEAELRAQKEALENLENSSDDAGDALENTADAAKEAGDGFTVAKGAISNLISNGISALVGACKNAISSLAGLADETRESRTAFAKLEQSFQTAGFSAETAEKTMSDLYGVLGDADRATEASALISKMSKDQEDLDKNTRILTGVFAEYGDSIPTEGLAEGMQATAQMGEVQGVLADALEWQGINLDEYNEKLGTMSSAEERAAYIQDTLTKLYGESADSYRENNSAIIEANEAQLDYQQSLNAIGDRIEPITTKVKEGFNKILSKVLELTENVDFDSFADKIDGAFEKFTNDILPKIENGLQWIIDNKDVLIAGITGIGAAFAAFKVVTLIQSVKTALEGMTVAQAALNFAMSLNPVGLVVAAVAGLVAAFVILWNKCDGFREFWIGLWDGIKSAAGAVADWFSETWSTVADWFSNLWSGIKDAASAAWDGIKAVFSTITGWLKAHIVDPIVNSTLFKIVTQLAEGCWLAIKAIFSAVSTWFSENVITPVQTFFSNLWSGIKDKASAAWEGIKAVFSKITGWISSTIIQPVTQYFSKLWDGFSSKASAAWDKVKSVFSKVASFFGDIFSKAWEKVKSVFSTGGKIFSGIVDGIESAFKKVVNKIIRGINKVVAIPFNAINKTLDKIRDVSIGGLQPFSGLIARVSVPEIPELAKGGVVRGATTAVIGEDGAEAIVPLEKNRQWIKAVAEELAAVKQQGVVINQTNNYSQAHSRLELYKSKQQTAAAVRLALGKV